MLEWLEQISDYHWFLAVIFVFALVDAVFPVVPSEISVIIGGVAAGLGNQAIGLVIGVAAVGAIGGDCLAYFIGRRSGRSIERRFLRGRRGPERRQRLDWATQQIDKQGIMLLITARFIPGGRTATTLSWGLTGQRWARFFTGTVIAGILWASYGGLLGLIGGRVFADRHTLAFLAAFAAALALNVVIAVARKLRQRGAGEAEAQSEDESEARTSSSLTAAKDS